MKRTLQFVFRKTLYGFSIMGGVVGVIFILFNLLPGDPARMMLGQRANQVSIDLIHKELGLNLPKGRQFLLYINDLSPVSLHTTHKESSFYFDENKYTGMVLYQEKKNILVIKTPYLRRSFQNNKPVVEIIKQSFPSTAVLAITAIFIGSILGILIGLLAAFYQNTWLDHTITSLAIIGMSGPTFFFGLLLAWFFGYILGEYTSLNIFGGLYQYDDYGVEEKLVLKNLILPSVTLGIRPIAVVSQLMKASMIAVLDNDFIRTAKSKGLSGAKVLMFHGLRNGINPVITAISGWFASLLAGAVLVEMVFSWNGLGYQLYQALIRLDLPLVMGIVLFIAMLFVFINTSVDIVYGLIDPRIRSQR